MKTITAQFEIEDDDDLSDLVIRLGRYDAQSTRLPYHILPTPTSAGVPGERGSHYLTADELADPEYMRAYIDELHSIIKDLAKQRPTSKATTQRAADGGGE